MVQNRVLMMFAPYAKYLGPIWFRRFLANHVPNRNFQLLKSLVDTLDDSSKQILRSKKEALLRGDEAVKQQVGQGKDIMSILRGCLPFEIY